MIEVKKVTGVRWHVAYYLEGKRIKVYKHPEFGDLAREKDLVKRTNMLNSLALIEHQRINQNGYYRVNIIAAINKVLADKKLYQKKNSFRVTQTYLNAFKNFLVKKNYDVLSPGQIMRSHVTEFIMYELSRTKEKSAGIGKLTNRTVNGAMIDVNAMFNYLINECVIESNPCKGIKKLPSRSEKNVSYTESEVAKIKAWCELHDPYLGLFLKFITYTFLRVDELRHIQLRKIDFENWFINMDAANIKTSFRQTKKIMQPLREVLELQGLQDYPKDYYMFSNAGTPGSVPVGINFFTKRFLKLKKDLRFSKFHTMYGMRHTFVCNLVANGATNYEIMALTGHTTLAAFENYMKDIKAMMPKDISAKFTISM